MRTFCAKRWCGAAVCRVCGFICVGNVVLVCAHGTPGSHVYPSGDFEVALYRALLAIYDLASSEEPSNRPSLIRLGSAAAPVARATVSAILLWWVSRRIALTISWRFTQRVRFGATGFREFLCWFLVMVVVLLHRWNPLVRNVSNNNLERRYWCVGCRMRQKRDSILPAVYRRHRVFRLVLFGI